MAFGVEELRVLRRALALALQPSPVSAEDVQDCLRLAEALDEAMREGVRMRAFLVADVARYRAALPGTAAGYLTLLEEALRAGYRLVPDDLTALRALRGNPAAAALLDRCRSHAGRQGRDEPGGMGALGRLVPGAGRTATPVASGAPGSRTHLTALTGGLAADAGEKPVRKPEKKPAGKPAPKPAPAPAAPKPARPIPTPGEVFPRRKPTPPPANAARQLVVAG
ncbi:hypothetical protein [Streptomyces blattellae]|uniref:hypothetical protein n=1 Tax=Streptomyces blattellae TaxID=2569855 RepID=UPI0012B78E10|nr:hypothetical protein [Streptomyces blattellae]